MRHPLPPRPLLECTAVLSYQLPNCRSDGIPMQCDLPQSADSDRESLFCFCIHSEGTGDFCFLGFAKDCAWEGAEASQHTKQVLFLIAGDIKSC